MAVAWEEIVPEIVERAGLLRVLNLTKGRKRVEFCFGLSSLEHFFAHSVNFFTYCFIDTGYTLCGSPWLCREWPVYRTAGTFHFFGDKFLGQSSLSTRPLSISPIKIFPVFYKLGIVVGGRAALPDINTHFNHMEPGWQHRVAMVYN